jgi:hypothetical protein
LKIPVVYNNDKSRVFIRTTVYLLDRAPIPIEFIIDTGSPITFVDEFSSQKVRVFADNLTFDRELMMTGTKIGFYKLDKAKIHFKGSEGQIIPIEYNDLKVSKSQWNRPGAVYDPVSILGLDFLNKTNSNLFLDPKRDVGYIEFPD